MLFIWDALVRLGIYRPEQSGVFLLGVESMRDTVLYTRWAENGFSHLGTQKSKANLCENVGETW